MKNGFIAIIIFFSFLYCNVDENNSQFPNIYHNYSGLKNTLININEKYPDITSIEQIGTSVEGRDLIAFIISDNPGVIEQEPRVRLTGAIHGNENVTTEMLIQFIEYVTANYDTVDYIRELVDNRYIVIIPMLNPDGVERGSRLNANRVDLNRNFSNFFNEKDSDSGGEPFNQPETRAIRDYSNDVPMHLSATYHAGAVVVNIQFDGIKSVPEEYNLVDYLARVYSISGRFLETPGLMDASYVDEGVVVGWEWYVASGTMQDWNYNDGGTIDATIEIYRYDPYELEELYMIFYYNRDAILAYIESAGMGVSGRVVTVNGNGETVPLKGAKVSIENGDLITNTDENGNYQRILRPGTYKLIFDADGYNQVVMNNVVVAEYNNNEFIEPIGLSDVVMTLTPP